MTIAYSQELPDLSTKAHVAEYLHVSVTTLDRMALAGVGPKRVRIGGRAVRYRRDDVLAYVRQLAEAV